MPFALLIIGVVLLVAGVRGSQDQLFSLVHGDFTGSDNFIYWFLAILIVGAIGYVPKLKPVSTAFLVLIILVLFLNKGKAGAGGGFFQQFTSAIGTTQNSTLNQVLSATGTTNLAQASQANQNTIASLQQQLAANLAAEQALNQ